MSLPRELRIRDGKLYQYPLRELELYRKNKVVYEQVRVKGNGVITSADSKPSDVLKGLHLPGVSRRCLDMEVVISRPEGEELFNKFTISLAADAEYHTDISFRPAESIVKIDRKFSGSRRAVIHQRRAKMEMRDDQIKFRIILDRFSAEVFINDGIKVMSMTLTTRQRADGIFFTCDKDALISVTKYDLQL
jgi:beta-fructofuranosidase